MKKSILVIFIGALLIITACQNTNSTAPTLEDKGYCLNNWETSASYVRDERFNIKINLEDLDKKERDGRVYSLPFGYHEGFFFPCEEERPSADYCFIRSILTDPPYSNSKEIPNDLSEYGIEKGRYIKSFEISCVCYYDEN